MGVKARSCSSPGGPTAPAPWCGNASARPPPVSLDADLELELNNVPSEGLGPWSSSSSTYNEGSLIWRRAWTESNERSLAPSSKRRGDVVPELRQHGLVLCLPASRLAREDLARRLIGPGWLIYENGVDVKFRRAPPTPVRRTGFVRLLPKRRMTPRWLAPTVQDPTTHLLAHAERMMSGPIADDLPR